MSNGFIDLSHKTAVNPTLIPRSGLATFLRGREESPAKVKASAGRNFFDSEAIILPIIVNTDKTAKDFFSS
jgi:hypothetical protein